MSVSLDTIRAGDMCLIQKYGASNLYTTLLSGHDVPDGDLLLGDCVFKGQLEDDYITMSGDAEFTVIKVLYNIYDVHKKLFREDGSQR